MDNISNDKILRRIGPISILMLILLIGLTLQISLLIQNIALSRGEYHIFTLLFTAGCIALCSKGIFVNDPNQAKIIEFFGHYIGTYFESGLLITIPFSTKRTISLKFKSINTEKIKVNDAHGNPIEISVVIVWKIYSPAKAYYNVNYHEGFVSIQSESIVRELASNYPYDSENNEESLRKNSEKIASELQFMLQRGLGVAGIEIVEARISYLAYSPEIAQVMLKRQQANAVTSARKLIVKNAINIVEEVVSYFENKKDMQLDEKQKARLINNLLIALISEQETQPVLSLDN